MSISKIQVKIPPQKGKTYEILIAKNLLANFSLYLKNLPKADKYIIITDNNIKKLFGLKLLDRLENKKLKVELLSFPSGEKSKTEETKTKLENKMIKLGCGRDTMIIALGGGVVGDLAGFIAATYMRGIPYIQVPTSLLAMVDSSTGGKTGIDTPHGKNLIGAFWQPELVLADLNFLGDLPDKQLVNGFIEALKMFMTNDAKMVQYAIENRKDIFNRNPKALEKFISRAIEIKSMIVGRDEREFNERMALNFGHTIGHAIETLSNYKIFHGEAVALGIIIEAKISYSLEILGKADFNLIRKIIKDLGINQNKLKKYKTDKIIKALSVDKKNRQGKPLFVLLEKLGKVKKDKDGNYAHFVGEDVIKKALKEINKK